MSESVVIAQAGALLRQGRSAEAAWRLRSAGSAGDAAALHELAIWYLIGSAIPRDLSEARRLLTAAAALGDEVAAMTIIAMTANGSGATADWPSAMAMLHRLSDAGSKQASSQWARLEAMALDDKGAPLRSGCGVPQVDDRRILKFPALLTAVECAHVAQVAESRLHPALVVDPDTGQQVPHPIRTSDAALIGPTQEDLVVRSINLRLAAASGTSVNQGEALTVLRYSRGQQFRLHMDAIGRTRNERIATFLIYLNDGYTGGETTFPEYDLTIRASCGDALLFFNTRPDGSADFRMRHAGLPVRTGVKWLATRWIRAREFDQWLGPEAA